MPHPCYTSLTVQFRSAPRCRRDRSKTLMEASIGKEVMDETPTHRAGQNPSRRSADPLLQGQHPAKSIPRRQQLQRRWQRPLHSLLEHRTIVARRGEAFPARPSNCGAPRDGASVVAHSMPVLGAILIMAGANLADSVGRVILPLFVDTLQRDRAGAGGGGAHQRGLGPAVGAAGRPRGLSGNPAGMRGETPPRADGVR